MCTALVALCTAAAAVEPGKIDTARLKPEALYIDLTDPTHARGIRLGDEELEVTERDGETLVMFKKKYVWVKLDPARVRPETPMLVTMGYYDPEQYDHVAGDLQPPDRPPRLSVQGFLGKQNLKGGYTTGSVVAPSHAGAWRWWTVFTYANYGMRASRTQSTFALNSRLGARWILVLPLTGESERGLHRIRGKVLAVLADYGRLLVAEASLQEVRSRLEQGVRYSGKGEATGSAAAIFEEVKAGAWQARIDMNSVITEVLFATDSAYLGLFDGNVRDRAATLEGFHQKVRRLLARYRALTAKGERAMLARAQAQCVRLGLDPVELRAPERLTPEHVIKREDFQNRFFIGYKGQEPVLQLPRRAIDVISQDLGIDLTYDSSYTLVVPLEDGSYDFSLMDRVLGKPQGIRVDLGMHNVRLPAWVRKKFWGEEIPRDTKLSGVVFGGATKYGGFRIKAPDGSWDGFMFNNGNDDSFTPGVLCAWSNTLFRYTCDYYRAVGRHYRDHPQVFRHMLNTETMAAQSMGIGRFWDAALPFYREHLRKKFRDIRKLNAAFGTAYGDFHEVPLPRATTGEKMVRLTPAWYEYTQLCIDRTKYVRESFARALREGDPNHVIGECQSSMFGGNSLDTYAFAVNTPYDTFAAGDSNTRSCRYQYSLNRYDPKPIMMYEPYASSGWTLPRGKGYRVQETWRRMLTCNMWRWFVWGHQAIPLFPDMPMFDGRIVDVMTVPGAYAHFRAGARPSIKLAAGCLKALRSAWDRLKPVLERAPVVPARIGLLESSTTHRVPHPAKGVFSDLSQLQGRLEQERRHFWFVPETALVEGREPMDQYRVIVAAYATHLRSEARDALLKWVKAGGVLIGSGPIGLYDEYGRTNGGLPETVFGMTQVEYAPQMVTADSKVAKCEGGMAGREGVSLYANRDFYWRLPSKGLAEGTNVMAALADGTPAVVERSYGKGKVILTTAAIGSQLDLYWPMVMKEIGLAQPVPEAASSSPDLSFQVRENPKGIRYLSVINGNVSAPVEATVTVAGEFERPRDLTVGEGWVIPADAGGGVTRFTIWLAPGNASFIELGKSRTELAGLSPEEENARMERGRFSNLVQRARVWGLDTSAEQERLKEVEKDCAAKRYADARSRLTEMTQALYGRWFEARTQQIAARVREAGVHPTAAVWAQSYAAIAQQRLRDGKLESAEERMDLAEKTLAERPEVHPAELTFPFVSERLDLRDLSTWPKDGWQTVYRDREAKTGDLGQFILVGSAEGIYIGAKVKTDKVTDRAQRAGLPWRVMDGVVLHFRGLDRTEALSNEFRSEDTYEITFYSDGSVFVWDNLLPCDAKLIRNEVTRTTEGYCVGGFMPAPAIRFWPRAGVNVIVDVCLYTYGDKSHGYWHGAYAQAATWARVRLGQGKASGDAGAMTTAVAKLPDNTAEPCLRVEHWARQETRGVGRASATFDAGETLPNGKQGAIVLTNDGQAEEAQLMTQFDQIGKRAGVRVWLKGTGGGARIALRATCRAGFTWQMILKDDSAQWRSVDMLIDRCQKTHEDFHAEMMNDFSPYRPQLNRLIVRFAKPLPAIKVGLIEYLPQAK